MRAESRGNEPCQLKRLTFSSSAWARQASATLLGMGNDIADDVGVVNDVEVKPPAAGHAGLPDAGGFVVFLGAQGRVGVDFAPGISPV